MTNRQIRAEIVELINSGLNVPKIVGYFRQYKPEADIKIVRKEAKELAAQARR